MKGTPAALREGMLVNSRYRICKSLGSGGMGWVLLAEDTQFRDFHVAIKILYPHLVATETSYKRFQTEVSITRKLSHPSIVQMYGFGRSKESLAYVSMEYVDGRSLAQIISQPNETLLMPQIEQILLQLLEGLSFAHAKGVIHRDLKPDNVLVKNDYSIKLADFGLAQMIRDEVHLTGAGNIVGTPMYMAPEQLRGEFVDKRSDIYSLGILAYELGQGTPPFEGNTLYELATLHLNKAVPQIAKRPQWFNQFIAQCTEKKPDDRFQSVEDAMRYALNCFSSDTAKGSKRILLPSETEISKGERAFWDKTIFRALLISFALLVYTVAMLFFHTNERFRGDVLILLNDSEKKLGISAEPIRRFFFINEHVPLDEVFGLGTTGMRTYLRLGGDPNVKNPETGEPLIHRFSKMMEGEGPNREFAYILKTDVDLNVKDPEGNTPIHVVVEARRNTWLKMLLAHGANPRLVDSNGLTPLAKAVHLRNPEMVRELCSYEVDINARIPGGKTAFHLAVRNGDLELLHFLLKEGADPNIRDDNGMTALSDMLRRKRRKKTSEEILNLLIAHTDLSLVDRSGKTALDQARESGNKRAEELIAAAQSNPLD